MNRHYTTAEFAALCRHLRALFPGCSLTTDIMVGFPGETAEEFSDSVAFAKEIGFARAHVFAYSRRPGTPADRMVNQISNGEKSRRSREMIAACEESAARYADGYIGRRVEVLLETPQPDGTVLGHTGTYLSVRCVTRRTPGELVTVAVTSREGDTLLAEE